ncbi:hypothetical protein DFP72DRAFT_1076277 [Ephemerocybe angulata]|uniref:Ubiquitin-like protease family profile domain-containing protein n=1 Tax=Ephemerocybe angulata TaxID=980116 RepID=A0A8H6HIY7_9AGAR|nr:hypothetical protein DFP72DRAFT_1076277 [Tulosesus angulatus]
MSSSAPPTPRPVESDPEEELASMLSSSDGPQDDGAAGLSSLTESLAAGSRTNAVLQARRLATRLGLGPYSRDLETYVTEDSTTRSVLLFARLLSIEQKVSNIAVATNTFAVSRALMDNIKSYVLAVPLSTELSTYKGTTPWKRVFPQHHYSLFNESMDDIDIASELDPDKVFNEKEWIEVKATYPEVAPIYLSDARAKTLAIPEHLEERFLTGNEAVEDLRQYSTAPQSGELLYTPIPTWFSKDPPTVTDADIFFSKSIPSPDHVKSGAVNTTEGFPVWAISVWKVLLGIKGAQREWNRALKWLESGEKRALRVGNMDLLEKVKEVRALAMKLPYEKKTMYLRGSATTKHLVHFLGTQLLTDDHINIMMHVLAEEVVPKGDSQSGEDRADRKVLVAPLHFSNEVYRLKNKLKLPEAQWKRTLLSRYANRVNEEGVDALYFPIHINRNHWIAGEIDFKRNTISYGKRLNTARIFGVHPTQVSREPPGDSIQLESSEYIPHKFHENLRRWTRRAFGKNFTCEGNALQHALQDDEYSCGIVTANTIEHTIHNDRPLWSPDNASASRMDWFIRIVHNLNGTEWVRKPGVEVPAEKLAAVREEMNASISTPETDYNFPDHAEAVLYEILKNLDDAGSTELDTAEETAKMGIPSSSRRRMDISELLNPVGDASSDGAESDASSASSLTTEPEEPSDPTAGAKRPASALGDSPETSRAAQMSKRPSVYLGEDIEAELRAAEDLGGDIEAEGKYFSGRDVLSGGGRGVVEEGGSAMSEVSDIVAAMNMGAPFGWNFTMPTRCFFEYFANPWDWGLVLTARA